MNSLKKQLLNMGFDEKTLRLLLDVKTLHSLPIMKITKRQLYNRMKSWFFNPIRHYPKYSRKIWHEVGHDEKYRYFLE